MTTRSTSLRRDAAALAWALRRSGSLPGWRQCVIAGLTLAAAIGQAKRSDLDNGVTDTMARLVRAGEVTPRPLTIAVRVAIDGWREHLRLQRAIARTRIGVVEDDLFEATRLGRRPTWERLAVLSLRRVPRGARTVCLDRHDYVAQVERFAEREHAPREPSKLAVLMGWAGEL